MTRPMGRAECGKRLVCAVPQGHWQTTTFIAGLRQDGLVAAIAAAGLRLSTRHLPIPLH